MAKMKKKPNAPHPGRRKPRNAGQTILRILSYMKDQKVALCFVVVAKLGGACAAIQALHVQAPTVFFLQ